MAACGSNANAAATEEKSDQPNISVVYFQVPGRAEGARLMAAIGGLTITDTRVTGAEWKTMKPNSPWITCPYMTVGDKAIGQCRVVNRLMGQLAGLVPEDPIEAEQCGEIHNVMEDLLSATFKAQGKEAREKLYSEGIGMTYLKCLEDFCTKNGTAEGYMMGNKTTYADVTLFQYLGNLTCGMVDHITMDVMFGADRKKCPKVFAVMMKVGSLQAVKDFYIKEIAALTKKADIAKGPGKYRYNAAVYYCGLTDDAKFKAAVAKLTA